MAVCGLYLSGLLACSKNYAMALMQAGRGANGCVGDEESGRCTAALLGDITDGEGERSGGHSRHQVDLVSGGRQLGT